MKLVQREDLLGRVGLPYVLAYYVVILQIPVLVAITLDFLGTWLTLAGGLAVLLLVLLRLMVRFPGWTTIASVLMLQSLVGYFFGKAYLASPVFGEHTLQNGWYALSLAVTAGFVVVFMILTALRMSKRRPVRANGSSER